ncbi:MAG: hypothetical protein H0Z29_09280 [Candidatus Marinimicrobia bacterium]|nr:hypothetical protein [Candidatus Neomarinimicrobiota bacterium]
MKKLLYLMFILSILTTILLPVDYYVTIYNKNVGMVRERRKETFKKGEMEIIYDKYTDAILENSINIRFLNKDIFLIEQSLSKRVLNIYELLEEATGKLIELELVGGKSLKAKLVKKEGNELILECDNKKISIIDKKNIRSIILATDNAKLPLKPVLKWRVFSEVSGEYPYEVSYLLKNVNWFARYLLEIPSNEDKDALFSSYFVIKNGNDMEFYNSKVKLIAGLINLKERRAEERMPASLPAFAMQSVQKPFKIEEREIEENYIFEIDKPISLRPHETKEIPYFEYKKVRVNKLLREFNSISWQGRKNLNVYYKIHNIKSSGLGIPLPAGKLSVLKKDEDGMLEFLGSDNVGNIPVNDTLVVSSGKSFDVSLDRRIMEKVKSGPRSQTVTVQIKVINRGKKEQKVEIIDQLPGNNYIKSSTHKYSKPQEDQIIFPLSINGEGEVIIEYIYTHSY